MSDRPSSDFFPSRMSLRERFDTFLDRFRVPTFDRRVIKWAAMQARVAEERKVFLRDRKKAFEVALGNEGYRDRACPPGNGGYFWETVRLDEDDNFIESSIPSRLQANCKPVAPRLIPIPDGDLDVCESCALLGAYFNHPVAGLGRFSPYWLLMQDADGLCEADEPPEIVDSVPAEEPEGIPVEELEGPYLIARVVKIEEPTEPYKLKYPQVSDRLTEANEKRLFGLLDEVYRAFDQKWPEAAGGGDRGAEIIATSGGNGNGRKPIVESKSGRVKLYGPNEEPEIDGVRVLGLTVAQYDVVLALVEAGGGLVGDRLVRKSGRGGAVCTLKRVATISSRWNSVVVLPGKNGLGGYQIL